MQEQVLTGGHGLMVQGYNPVIKALSKDIDIRLNHRCRWVSLKCGSSTFSLFLDIAAMIIKPYELLRSCFYFKK